MAAPARGIELQQLKDLPPEGRSEALANLTAHSASEAHPPEEALESLDKEIREYERRYEISSERMLGELEEGSRKETAEIASWLMRLSIRDRIVDGRASS